MGPTSTPRCGRDDKCANVPLDQMWVPQKTVSTGLPFVYSKGLSRGVEGPSDQKLKMSTGILEPIEVVRSKHLCQFRPKGLK